MTLFEFEQLTTAQQHAILGCEEYTALVAEVAAANKRADELLEALWMVRTRLIEQAPVPKDPAPRAWKIPAAGVLAFSAEDATTETYLDYERIMDRFEQTGELPFDPTASMPDGWHLWQAPTLLQAWREAAMSGTSDRWEMVSHE